MFKLSMQMFLAVCQGQCAVFLPSTPEVLGFYSAEWTVKANFASCHYRIYPEKRGLLKENPTPGVKLVSNNCLVHLLKRDSGGKKRNVLASQVTVLIKKSCSLNFCFPLTIAYVTTKQTINFVIFLNGE